MTGRLAPAAAPVAAVRPAVAGPTRLRLILGDQLAADSPLITDCDPSCDLLVMIEAPGEATHVWSHRARIALFLAAMRQHAASLRARGLPLRYVTLDEPDFAATATLVGRLDQVLADTGARELLLLEPGDWRLETELRELAAQRGLALTLLPDPHFLCSRAEFASWVGGRRELRMEHFYRWMRRRHGVLLDGAGEPLGGAWNFDADNRSPFPRGGPGAIAPPAQFAPDGLTREVIALVERRFPDHPGSLAHFAWPVTRAQALAALECFVTTRLAQFGRFQDAMWTDTPFGWHALLSTSLNLKLLDPREVIAAAEQAHRAGKVELASAEGFIRQVLGWREFIRGVYWHEMPGLASANHYGHRRALPRWYWTGDTRMACQRACIGQTLAHGYAHHIQRLMVTGQFALLAQIDPAAVCDWYLAVYVDAVDWVERPNTAGMALYANGGRFTSKPYVASGQYIRRQSNYCTGCAYTPEERSGSRACPVTTLYWNFLLDHEAEFAASPRTALMARNLARLPEKERAAIRDRAAAMLANLDLL